MFLGRIQLISNWIVVISASWLVKHPLDFPSPDFSEFDPHTLCSTPILQTVSTKMANPIPIKLQLVDFFLTLESKKCRWILFDVHVVYSPKKNPITFFLICRQVEQSPSYLYLFLITGHHSSTCAEIPNNSKRLSQSFAITVADAQASLDIPVVCISLPISRPSRIRSDLLI